MFILEYSRETLKMIREYGVDAAEYKVTIGGVREGGDYQFYQLEMTPHTKYVVYRGIGIEYITLNRFSEPPDYIKLIRDVKISLTPQAAKIFRVLDVERFIIDVEVKVIYGDDEIQVSTKEGIFHIYLDSGATIFGHKLYEYLKPLRIHKLFLKALDTWKDPIPPYGYLGSDVDIYINDKLGESMPIALLTRHVLNLYLEAAEIIWLFINRYYQLVKTLDVELDDRDRKYLDVIKPMEDVVENIEVYRQWAVTKLLGLEKYIWRKEAELIYMLLRKTHYDRREEVLEEINRDVKPYIAEALASGSEEQRREAYNRLLNHLLTYI